MVYKHIKFNILESIFVKTSQLDEVTTLNTIRYFHNKIPHAVLFKCHWSRSFVHMSPHAVYNYHVTHKTNNHTYIVGYCT